MFVWLMFLFSPTGQEKVEQKAELAVIMPSGQLEWTIFLTRVFVLFTCYVRVL